MPVDHPTLPQLCELMRKQDIVPVWYELGMELLNNEIALKVIKASCRDIKDGCTNMFEKWLEIQPNASWSQLVIALKNIERCTAAEAVSKQYIAGNELLCIKNRTEAFCLYISLVK